MAELPIFFYPEKLVAGQNVKMPEDTARHIAQVLRMQVGEALQLCDGQGMMAVCCILKSAKKWLELHCEQVNSVPCPEPSLRLAVSFTKNASRNEWLLEKATELGVARITPLITERGNREKYRAERWNSILLSAMLQSRQYWLPRLDPPMPLPELVTSKFESPLYIAHCLTKAPESQPQLEDSILKRIPMSEALKKGQNACVLIGPEGDFSVAELTLALSAGAIPVSLGSNRLRTETAALAVLTSFYLLQHAPAN